MILRCKLTLPAYNSRPTKGLERGSGKRSFATTKEESPCDEFDWSWEYWR